MWSFSKLRWWLLVRHGGMSFALAFVAGVIFVWSGFYNVAASSDHWRITTWILERVRIQSVATWSYFVDDPPPLDDPDLIRLGAAHYESGCAVCHSRPGEPINLLVGNMLPQPLLLAASIADETPKELFWIIKHGLKYTAMPAWPAQDRNDEVWALTAFVDQLPGMSPEEYLELAGVGHLPAERANPEDLAESSETVALTQCVRCHGNASLPPISRLVPVLHGQSQTYLERALAEYAGGLRSSGVMQPAAGLLTPAEQRAIAGYYASLDTFPRRREPAPDRIDRGRELAMRGDAERGIPPCLACHSDERAPSFPSLAGQSARYLANQLQVWRSGARDMSTHGKIMAAVARRLTAEQVEEAATYFSSLDAGQAPAIASRQAAEQ